MASMAAFFNGEASLPLGGAEALRFLRGGMVLFCGGCAEFGAYARRATRAARAAMRRKTGEQCAMRQRWSLARAVDSNAADLIPQLN